MRSTASGHRKRERPLRLSDLAAAHVRELIVSCQLRAGEFIPPEAVADELGITTPASEGLLLTPRRQWC